jgi:hypothetical protein
MIGIPATIPMKVEMAAAAYVRNVRLLATRSPFVSSPSGTGGACSVPLSGSIANLPAPFAPNLLKFDYYPSVEKSSQE